MGAVGGGETRGVEREGGSGDVGRGGRDGWGLIEGEVVGNDRLGRILG